MSLTYGGFKPKAFPATPGLEAVGRVEQSGPGASKYAPGTRVVAVPWGTLDGEGTWQQYAVVPEAALLPVPDSLPDEAAAQFLINPGEHSALHTTGLPLASCTRVTCAHCWKACMQAG